MVVALCGAPSTLKAVSFRSLVSFLITISIHIGFDYNLLNSQLYAEYYLSNNFAIKIFFFFYFLTFRSPRALFSISIRRTWHRWWPYRATRMCCRLQTHCNRNRWNRNSDRFQTRPPYSGWPRRRQHLLLSQVCVCLVELLSLISLNLCPRCVLFVFSFRLCVQTFDPCQSARTMHQLWIIK